MLKNGRRFILGHEYEGLPQKYGELQCQELRVAQEEEYMYSEKYCLAKFKVKYFYEISFKELHDQKALNFSFNGANQKIQ